MKAVFLSVLMLSVLSLQAQLAFVDSSSVEISISKMNENFTELDVLFFGEIHTDSIDHVSELMVLKHLDSLRKGNLKLGMEMLERDQQVLLDEYAHDLMSDKYFSGLCEFWANYATDYHPMVKYAKDSSIKVVGTNVPNRYAKMVYYYGNEYLHLASKEAKEFFTAPDKFDTTLKSYVEIKEYVPSGHNANYLLQAQVLKDATMAASIIESKQKKELFYHINGKYHTKNGEGIIWYLKEKKSKLKIGLITRVEGGTPIYLYREY